MILTTDSKNVWKIHSDKILWGLLSLFLLGFIAQFVFVESLSDAINENENEASQAL